MFSGNTETLITATYQDADGTIDLTVDNDLSNYDNSSSGFTTNIGDITGVTITTDSGGGSKAQQTSGRADFSILGSNGVGVTNSSETITVTAVSGEIDHDSLNNWSANKHIDWTSASAGTIDASNYTNTTYSVMSSGNSYAAGLVAAGSGTHGSEFLRKDGTWVVPTNTTYSIGDGGLTTNDFTNDDHTKLNGIAAGAEINVQADWNESSSGSDAFIANKPTIPSDYVTNNADDIMLGSLNLKKISDDATARSLIFEKNRATATTANDGDAIGQIEWKAYNDAGTPELGTFAAIKATVVDASNSDEIGKIEFQVLGEDEFVDDNTPITALKLTGISGNYEHADVEMGTGSYSTIKSVCFNHEFRYNPLSGASYEKERIFLKPGNPFGGQTPQIIIESTDPVDFFKIEVNQYGATTISTTEDGVGANADLTISADGNLLANAFGNAEIDSSNGNITLDSNLDIILDADGDQISMKWGGATGQIDFTNENSGDGVIQQKVDAKDLVIKQYDGNEVIRFKDNKETAVGDTLIIEKTSSTNTTSSNYGEKIDLNYTGNTAAGQTVTNYGLDIDLDFTGNNASGANTNSFGINIAMNKEAGTHSAASGVDNTGIKAVLTGDTETANTTQIGYDLTITGGDTGSQTGLLLNTDDGSTDIKIVSSANTADYFTIKTFEDGATTFTTVEDGGGSTANMSFIVDGQITMNSANIITIQSGAGEAIVFEDSDNDVGQFAATGLTIATISEISSDTDKFLMSESGVVKYVTGANLRSYIGAGTGDVTLSGSTDNTIATVTGANALAGEANLTFDGTDLSIASTGKLILGAGDTSISESSSDVLNITVGGQSMMAFTESGSAGSAEFINCSTGIIIASGTPLYFDGGGLAATHISESSADNLRFTVGGDTVLDLTEDATGNTVNMGTSAAGFTRSTYADATDVTVDFRTGNKAHLDMTGGSIGGTLTLQFPAVSGNFVLVVQQDGSIRTIAAYATKDAAGNAGNNDGGTAGAIRWAGGSAPDLTDGGNKRDVLSFYWDATEEVCYGVASLNF